MSTDAVNESKALSKGESIQLLLILAGLFCYIMGWSSVSTFPLGMSVGVWLGGRLR